MAEFYRVREPFWLTTKQGVPRVCTAGEILSSDDPDLKGREQFCDKLTDFIARTQAAVTETASAAPGEVRAVRRIGRPRKHQPAPVPTPEPAPVVGDETESELS